MRRGGWLGFWLAAAAATLTKGPLGVVLAGLGLLATLWERRAGSPWPLRGSQLGGVIAFLAITVGWFVLAYRRAGPHLLDDMIRQELMGHVVEHAPGRRFFKPIGDFMANFAPWSVLACAALVRLVRSPPADARVRRFARFLACWCVAGLLLFSLSPHNPARLLWPLVPAAALLAGRELARLTRALDPGTLARACVATAVVACGFFVVQYHYVARLDPDVQVTLALRHLATEIERAGGGDALEFAEAPPALQVVLNVLRPALSLEDAAMLLRNPAPAFIVVENPARLRRMLGPDAPPLYELAHGMLEDRPYLYVVANRPDWSMAPARGAVPSAGAEVP